MILCALSVFVLGLILHWSVEVALAKGSNE